jgi:MFS family permease
MAGLRIILGALEAGLYPGSVYLLSTWYPRYELQKRNATFYLIGSMASGFGGILAYGLMQMDGLAGRAGWRWIFIVSQAYTYIPNYTQRNTNKYRSKAYSPASWESALISC